VKICLLGAESTGKSTLAQELAAHFRSQGRSAVAVPEVLREWCSRAGRTPRPEEQLPIAQEQEARADAAAAQAEIVIADTSALMVAIYGAMLFEGGALYRFAIERQRTYDSTLVTGLDLPWVPDGLQRDGPEGRAAVDAQVRDTLAAAAIAYRVVYGTGPERLRNALLALGQAQAQPAGASRAWTWSCEKCSDPACEHRLFSALIEQRGS
jgi:nicotinamide riboside kinase